ncbi:uncharacterized protein H6S33_012783 [Morchella sextelata]|uniref:uncharacterized protein n=1 Tax=Morchella sextelata TaxID=1174677 RepID=UPI001D051DBB|nr:uncharacterized protein H6S33_012783 [Morchella sextelata]KAH0609297.1 hypothetical protein H6S33_012783 [Morchella sextelata]
MQARLEEIDKDSTAGGPDWVRAFAKKQQKEKLYQEKADLETRLSKIREKEKKEKERSGLGIGGSRAKKRKGELEVEIDGGNDNEDLQFILDDYDSEDEGGDSKSNSNGDFSPAVMEMMKRLGIPMGADIKDEDLEVPDEIKIFYCSRTHSQLTQFVNELRRVKFPPSFAQEDTKAIKLEEEEEIKHIPLGSRKNLCINSKVTKLSNPTAINERCLELQRSGTQESRCQFLPEKDDKVLIRDFRDHTLAKIRDIEELASLGKKMGICPYYASRPTIKSSEIVTLPYPLLLQKSAREALDLSLNGHIVVIDEAHNLINAISSIYSINVSLNQLERCQAQLEIYLNKFRNRLKGKNKVYVMQVTRILSTLTSYLKELDRKGGEGAVIAGDLLAMNGMDQLNFFKLQRYLNESKLARKVEGYVVHIETKEQEKQHKKSAGENISNVSIPTLTHIQGFLLALTNPSTEGRIFYGKMEDKKVACFRYMLLDPAHHFKEIVEEARAVILAGGTMEPMNDYMMHLFPYLPKERIRTFSCGHVIPKENLVALPVSKGPSGREFEFTFEKRMLPAMIEDLGRAIINLCLVIPHGVVCFFPSYAYLEYVVSQWKKTSGSMGKSIWERLADRKIVFRESSDGSSVEDILKDYAQAIDSGKGSLLLSVVGGKMSEGINFNDNLGRGIIMVGLPFPNSNTAEWRARLEHVEKVARDSYLTESSESMPSDSELEAIAKAAGREFYDNACMRAVNQSIGRAIRHREDYAVIILFDKRYITDRITSKLPGWIQNGLVRDRADKPFSDVMANIGRFFREKKTL